MTGGRSFPFRMRHGAPSLAQRIELAPGPASRSSDEAGAGTVPYGPAPASSHLCGDATHGGSCDLETWPPSTVEMELARTVIRVPDADKVAEFASALTDLIIVTQSPERGSAILHLARVERAAERVIARIGGAR